MQYVGIQTQQSRNNFRSLLLLCLFPVLVCVLVLLFCYLFVILLGDGGENNQMQGGITQAQLVIGLFIQLVPYVLGGVLIWFLIAYFAHTRIINTATGSKPLSRMENKRIYDLVENLCVSQGMKMPKIRVTDDDSLNALASGINERSYTVTLSRGIINKLNDQEQEAVIAHELSHIRNHDVRLLIISIVFVGIFSMMAVFMRYLESKNEVDYGPTGRILGAFLAVLGYYFSIMMRFAISRKREYLADAGAAEMTKNPLALASALRKISADPNIEAVKRDDVAQLLIQHPRKPGDESVLGGLSGLFATHPPIKKRIQILEQF